MKICKGTIFILFLLLSITTQSQWKKLEHNLPNWSIGDAISVYNDMIFISIRTEGKIRHPYLSKDKGQSWKLIEIPDPKDYSDALDVEIINQNLLVAVFQEKYSVSTDGGETWENYFADTTSTDFFNYVEFFDENNGIIMGDAIDSTKGTPFFKTSDGGITWEKIESNLLGANSGGIWRRLDFINKDIGFFRVSSMKTPTGVYKTVDGGNNWEIISSDLFFHSIKFYDENFGFGLFSDKIMRTTDGGLNWTESSLFSNQWGNDIEFNPNNPSEIWCTNGAGLYHSIDSGKTWISCRDINGNIINKASYTARDYEFNIDGSVWLLCDLGNIWYLESQYITDLSNHKTIPHSSKLHQNYPNPFNPTTSISFDLSKNTFVKLTIFDILGNKVETLVNKVISAGKHTVNFNASKLSSGTYFYKLETPNYSATKKLLLIK